MKAVTYEKYGKPDVLRIDEVDVPAPKDDEVLVEIRAASLNAYDWHFLTADIFLIRLMGGGVFKPKYRRLGADISGRVKKVGKNVTRFKEGDRVFGIARGGFAEFACAPENSLSLKPKNLDYSSAAAVPMAAVTALQALRDAGKIQAGNTVLINGASGGVGTFSIQIAKMFGAEVTAVCSTDKVPIAKKLGADFVIDYVKENFSAGKKKYDLIIAANGNRTMKDYRRALNPGGTCVIVGGTLFQLVQAMLGSAFASKKAGQKIKLITAKARAEDLDYLGDILATGRISPVIDRIYPFDECADALRYFGLGHTHGKVVLLIKNDKDTKAADL